MSQNFKVDVLPPYDHFSTAYVSIDRNYGRRMVTLYSPNQKAFYTTYARYLFQIDYWKKYSNYIPDGYEVDHINEDKMDDRLDNFQLLTHSENVIKNNFSAGSTKYILCCPMCSKLFQIEKFDHFEGTLYCCSSPCYRSINATRPSREVRDYLSLKQLRWKVKVFKHFPDGYEYVSEILENNTDCFYPNSLEDYTTWLPDNLVDGLRVVFIDKRKEMIFKLSEAGMSERKIADHLNVSRKVVQRALERI